VYRAAEFLTHSPRTAWSAPSRLGRLGLLYRKLLIRLLCPHTARQRELEHSEVDGLREVELAREQLKARVRELEQEPERQRGGM
jgi:hypothetical protein